MNFGSIDRIRNSKNLPPNWALVKDIEGKINSKPALGKVKKKIENN